MFEKTKQVGYHTMPTVLPSVLQHAKDGAGSEITAARVLQGTGRWLRRLMQEPDATRFLSFGADVARPESNKERARSNAEGIRNLVLKPDKDAQISRKRGGLIVALKSPQ
jgi:hypothetical protein